MRARRLALSLAGGHLSVKSASRRLEDRSNACHVGQVNERTRCSVRSKIGIMNVWAKRGSGDGRRAAARLATSESKRYDVTCIFYRCLTRLPQCDGALPCFNCTRRNVAATCEYSEEAEAHRRQTTSPPRVEAEPEQRHEAPSRMPASVTESGGNSNGRNSPEPRDAQVGDLLARRTLDPRRLPRPSKHQLQISHQVSAMLRGPRIHSETLEAPSLKYGIFSVCFRGIRKALTAL
jgi:hypothetical protein